MRTSLAIYLVLALTQVTQVEPADFIMELAVEKSIQDRKAVERLYDFDKKSSGESASKGDGMNISEIFRNGRYQYSLVDLAMSDGRAVYVLNFYPKPKRKQLKAPKGSSFSEERRNDVLNSLKGTVHVSPENFGIVRVETHTNKYPTPEPETIWRVGRLYQMDTIMEQVPLGDFWVPKQITVTADYSYFLWVKRLQTKVRIEFSNFRLKAP